MIRVFRHNHPFLLESGGLLKQFHLAYTTHGQLNAKGSNVVWIFHALTGNSDPAEWWPGLVGEGCLFNAATHFIVCVNMPGSCYGSISPLDVDPETGAPFYHRFPLFTTRDMIRAYSHLKDHLGIRRIAVGLGGSMGGQQLLEWAIEEPQLFEHIIPAATNAIHSPWGIAFNASQRFCIEGDPTWKEEKESAGLNGMKIARGVALLSYRHYSAYEAAQQGYLTSGKDEKVFKAQTYQHYQGEKLAKRFNAFSYHVLSRSMDAHDVGRGRDSVAAALKKIKAKTLVISISSDLLFPTAEQQYLAQHIPGALLAVIDSDYGHDGFLVEGKKMGGLAAEFLKETSGISREIEMTAL